MKKCMYCITAAALALAAGVGDYSHTAAASGTKTTAQDVSHLQNFLLHRPAEDLTGKPYDLNGDGCWDVFDLCLMKRGLMNDTRSESRLLLTVGEHRLTATLADSTAAGELAEKLRTAPVTVTLNEYGGFEKVGALPWTLTRTDESTVTAPGDIMLYQGDQMTVFYGSNSWRYTKLGTLDYVTQDELQAIFGEGAITVTLSMQE